MAHSKNTDMTCGRGAKASLAAKPLPPRTASSSSLTVLSMPTCSQCTSGQCEPLCKVGRLKQLKSTCLSDSIHNRIRAVTHIRSLSGNSAEHNHSSLLCSAPALLPAWQGLCLLTLAKNLPGDASQLLFILSPYSAAPQAGCSPYLHPHDLWRKSEETPTSSNVTVTARAPDALVSRLA